MSAADPAIRVEGLTKRFGDFTAVDHLSMSVPKGVIYGFLGPNGSGKTTTIRMMCGLLTPDEGEGTALGYDILTEGRRIKKRVGYMTQRFSLYEELSVRENLNFMARMYGEADVRARVDAVMAEIERYCEEASLEKNVTEDKSGIRSTETDSFDVSSNDIVQTTNAPTRRRVIPKLVASGTGGWQYVDVVSRRAGKLESLEYVRTAFRIHTSRTVACGDSGNDIAMLGGANKAIVVGNAQPALARWAANAAAKETDPNRLFLAEEKEALGVLEGLRAFGLMTNERRETKR